MVTKKWKKKPVENKKCEKQVSGKDTSRYSCRKIEVVATDRVVHRQVVCG